MPLEQLKKVGTLDILHALGLAGMGVGLVFGKAILSISLLFTLIILIVKGDFKAYWNNIVSNRFLHLVVLYFLYLLISLIWSNDIGFGLHDVKVRSSLVLILITYFSAPPKKNILSIIGSTFISAIILATIINFIVYHVAIAESSVDDIRGMSLFGSHVRFAILVVVGIILILYTKWNFKSSTYVKAVLILWLVYYSYYSQVITGYMSVFSLAVVLLFYILYQRKKFLAFLFLGLTAFSLFILGLLLFKPIEIDRSKYENLPYATLEGNPYYHNPVNIQPETGEPTEIMICWLELEREWNQRSKIPFHDGRDLKGQLIKTTLIRYLASKKLNKDAIGLTSLSSDEIKKIESGQASIYGTGIMARWYSLRYQLLNDADPNGHSFLERIEFWKTGVSIAKDNLFLGTGIGDIQLAFDEAYERNNSKLVKDNRNRTHNMFLTTLISTGLIGLFLFIWFHVHFIQLLVKHKQLPGVLFAVVLVVSYLIEDTLETQVGVSTAAFFLGFFYSSYLRSNEGSLS